MLMSMADASQEAEKSCMFFADAAALCNTRVSMHAKSVITNISLETIPVGHSDQRRPIETNKDISS